MLSLRFEGPELCLISDSLAQGDAAGKERALEVLEAAGNFTECRAAAVSLFKKGSGEPLVS